MASVSIGNQGDEENVIVEELVTTSSEEAKQEEDEELILEPSDMSDVALVVEGKTFKTHRLILSMWSPVFKSMFTAEFKEKYSQEIPLPGKKAHEIREMLLVMYPTIMKPISEENCYFLLPLAEEYQMKKLREKCEDCLLDNFPKSLSFNPSLLEVGTALVFHTTPAAKPEVKCIDLLILGQEYGLERLLRESITGTKKLTLEEITGHEKYPEINDKNLCSILIGKVEKLEKDLDDARRVGKRYAKDTSVKGLEAKITSLQNRLDHSDEMKKSAKCYVESVIKEIGQHAMRKRSTSGNKVPSTFVSTTTDTQTFLTAILQDNEKFTTGGREYGRLSDLHPTLVKLHNLFEQSSSFEQPIIFDPSKLLSFTPWQAPKDAKSTTGTTKLPPTTTQYNTGLFNFKTQ